jgi:hypothetical protein
MYNLDDIDMLAEIAITNKSERENIMKIDPRIMSYYNTINVFVGKQGQGKTFSAVKEIAKITNANNTTCLVVYITREGTKCDDTFESLKHLIRVPILYVAENKAEEIVQRLEYYMQQYKEIKDYGKEYSIAPTFVNRLFRELCIKDFKEPYLHIIILFDDFANSVLVKKPESYFSKFIATLRHRGFSVFICVQFWKSIPTQLKANISMIYVFSGYSRQHLRYILYQVPLSESIERIIDEYNKLHRNDKMIIDAIDGVVYYEFYH